MTSNEQEFESGAMSLYSESVARPLHKQQPCSRPRQHGGNLLLSMALLSMIAVQVQAWGNSASGELDESVFGNTFGQDWLYDSKSLSFKAEGCVWGYVDDSEEVGCLQDESEDGTTNWYMMANCRRPQVAFSVYASSSGSTSCNSNNFVGSVSPVDSAWRCSPLEPPKLVFF